MLDSHPNDPNIVFSAGYDGYVVLWDLRTGKPLKTLHETEAKISDGHFSRNGNYFVVSDKDGFFTLFGTGPQYKGVCLFCPPFRFDSFFSLTLGSDSSIL